MCCAVLFCRGMPCSVTLAVPSLQVITAPPPVRSSSRPAAVRLSAQDGRVTPKEKRWAGLGMFFFLDSHFTHLETSDNNDDAAL